MTRGLAVVACGFACALALAFAGRPATARAAAATSSQVRALARAAGHDPAALARLRTIDVVDGRPAALAVALRGSPADVRARLLVLASDSGPVARSSGRAREQARAVLAERRFHAATITSPLSGVRDWIGAQLRRLGRPFEDLFAWIARWFPGGAPLLAIVLGLLALAGVTALALRLGVRRLGTAPGRTPGAAGDEEERMSAARLRDLAELAERRGELDEALRLRFRAGLVELDSRELIVLRPAVTNRELLRDVDSPTLDGLVAGFEAVAYGGRAAGADDVRGAREGWPRVAGEATTR